MSIKLCRMCLVAIGFLLAGIIAGTMTFAASSCNVIAPTGPIWYNKNNVIDISCTCPAGTTQLKNTFITKFYSTPVIFNGMDTTWRYTLNLDNRLEPKKYGTYMVASDCLDGNYTTIGNFSGSFMVHLLEGAIARPTQAEPAELYLTEKPVVEYKLFKDGSVLTLEDQASAGGNLNFRAFLNNQATPDKKIAETTGSYDKEKQLWIIPTYNLKTVDGLSSENRYSLKVSAEYTEPLTSMIILTNVESNVIKTRSSLVASLVPGTLPEILDLTDSTKKDVKVRVIYLGNPAKDLDISHFDAYIEKKGGGGRTSNAIDPNGFTYNEGDGYYILPVNILKQDPGEYELKISVWYEGVGEVVIKAATIRFVLAFQGDIIDSSGNVVSAKIVLKNNDTEIPIMTDSGGKYNIPITAGTYDITMQFPEVWRVALTGVNIGANAIDPINYDYFAGNPDIEGLTVAKLVVLEFGIPFDRAELEIPYNDAAIDNEKNIKTYACTNWNFGKRKCIGEWKDVMSTVNIVRDVVSFKTDMLTAFVIGERRGLWLDAATDKKDYAAREPITVTGKVLDTKSVAIKNAEITLAVEGTDITGKATSGDGGIFTAILAAPDNDGIFNIIASAKKSPYIIHNMTYTITVARKKEVSLMVPEVAEVKIDEPQTVKVTIFNSGQAEVTNAKLTISGLKETWYNLSTNIFESIPPSERRYVDINVYVPASECAIEDCTKYYFVNAQFKSDQITENTAFTTKIKRNESLSEEAKTENNDGIPFQMNVPDITGFVPAIGSERMNIYLAVFFASVIFIVITIKKRLRGSFAGGPRSFKMQKMSASSLLNAIKSRMKRK